MRDQQPPAAGGFADVVEFAARAHADVRIYGLPGVSIDRYGYEGRPVEELAHGCCGKAMAVAMARQSSGKAMVVARFCLVSRWWLFFEVLGAVVFMELERGGGKRSEKRWEWSEVKLNLDDVEYRVR